MKELVAEMGEAARQQEHAVRQEAKASPLYITPGVLIGIITYTGFPLSIAYVYMHVMFRGQHNCLVISQLCSPPIPRKRIRTRFNLFAFCGFFVCLFCLNLMI